MKAFIIGAAGFVGGHLMDEMLRLGWTVGASKMPQETIAIRLRPGYSKSRGHFGCAFRVRAGLYRASGGAKLCRAVLEKPGADH